MPGGNGSTGSCHARYEGGGVIWDITIKNGVPQGSNLGPILFNTFINDLVFSIKHSEVLLYADDLKIFNTISHIKCSNLIQNDIDNIFEWSQKNKMLINLKKCFSVSYSRNQVIPTSYSLEGNNISVVTSFKDMGIKFDQRLLFKMHIDETVKASFKSLGAVIRICRNFDKEITFKILYNALVRSKLEYASVVWNPSYKTNSDQIEMVQKRFLRYLYFRRHGSYPHYLNIRTSTLLNEFKYQSLADRRVLKDCTFLYHILHNKIDSPELLSLIPFKYNNRNTRNPDTFYVSKIKNFYDKTSLMNRIMLTLDTIAADVDLFFDSVTTLKKNIMENIVFKL